jgi:deoxyadenosine/deoxycytidine kinase
MHPDRLLRNISHRGREYEKSISGDYLKSIQESYFSFFRQNIDNKYLIIDINEIDFVENEQDYESLKEVIFSGSYSTGINTVIL